MSKTTIAQARYACSTMEITTALGSVSAQMIVLRAGSAWKQFTAAETTVFDRQLSKNQQIIA